ncbi:hypothetical protein AKJ36_01550 [candidate division MSBL1 archaeon SCGC-AAA259I07]|uniref:UspA domain-containing protein n=1 Tax=candidate division MSBL1 archaeon SCGC-AAA259I07 TaxID=1698266 RepID=A0A133ULJ7_9EURY|nr:hypothetical protein AKJ36_01550 [candidate division MSBL1 archaeon SCGC-AAA259I07]
MKNEYEYKNLLVPVKHPDDVNRVTELSSVLLDKGRVTFLTVIKKGSFPSVQEDWRKSSRAIENYENKITSRKIRIMPKIRYSNSIWKGIVEQAEEDESDMILMGWGRKITFRSLRQTPVENVLSHSDRDVVVFRNQDSNITNTEKILLPVAYEDYDYSKRLSLVLQLIKSTGAECTLIHILRKGHSREKVEKIFHGPRQYMKERGTECKTKIIENDNIPEALIQESENYDLIVLGPTREYVFSRYMFGWLTDEIVNNAKCSSIVFKEAELPWKAWIKGAIYGLGKELLNFFK